MVQEVMNKSIRNCEPTKKNTLNKQSTLMLWLKVKKTMAWETDYCKQRIPIVRWEKWKTLSKTTKPTKIKNEMKFRMIKFKL